MGWFKRLLGRDGHDVAELARRLDLPEQQLRDLTPAYREFSIPKSTTGSRDICAPSDELKQVQRRILRRLLTRLGTHPAAVGFQRGESIVTHARRHVGQAVVIRFDLANFFDSTSDARVQRYFRKIGWNRAAARLLTRLCTWIGSLPQGAPTSPRLSNLVNGRLDARLAGLAESFGAVYSRYADDLTFSFAEYRPDDVGTLRGTVRLIVEDEGYLLRPKKTRIRRQHHRQLVTGLVVNRTVNLPRVTRRWLRAVVHRSKQSDWRNRSAASGLAAGRPTESLTLTASQLAGWLALLSMIDQQRNQ